MSPLNVPLQDGEFLKAVLDELDTNLYITDADTDRIVYMNPAMKAAFHLEHPEGQICWQVLQKGMTGRCDFCKIGPLSAPESPRCWVWEEVNTAVDRNYKNYDHLLKWNGRLYHLQSSVDVTEYRQLSERARTDELTGMLNRRAGKEYLAEILETARCEGKVITVALYDINELKLVNDQYGHSEGDRLLHYVARVTKENLGSRDIAFRLSGDEFVLVFHDTDHADAERHMQNIALQLETEREQAGIFYPVSFSWGLFEVFPRDQYAVSDILSKADQRMYAQKRNYHIHRAQQKLADTLSAQRPAGPFDYDKEHLYEALAASTEDYLFVGNLQTGIFRYSPSMVLEFGLPNEVVDNAAAFWGKLIHPQDEAGFLKSNQEIADGRTDSHCIEYRAKNVQGEWIWLRCRGKMLRDENGAPCLFAGFITNLGKKEQLDHMTGLYNRFEFEGDVKKQLVDQACAQTLAIMILDMDTFKNINDLYDRSFGDAVLRRTAQKLSSMLPPGAALYRMDGDEFAVLLQKGTAQECTQLFDRIQHTFRKQQEYDGRKYFCTISAGVACHPQDAGNYQELLKYANYSLEESKRRGKNRLTLFSPSLLGVNERRLELIELLRESIERGFVGFSVYYQPQVNAATGALCGAEALARWQGGKYGALSPGEFIPLLEETGMIVPLGDWILRQAVRQCSEWRRRQPDFHISVNLSYLQLLEGDLTARVRQAMKDVSLPSSGLTLELTETYLIKEDKAIHSVLHCLRQAGISLAMDDFGTGYSSLTSLKNTPVDFVKIDRGFVRNIVQDPFNATFVRAITDLCHNVGKIVCLEGVETEEEYRAVQDIGLDLIQGFYFGRPVPAPDFEKAFFR